MKKFGLIAALFACIFGFAACEDETNPVPPIEPVKYIYYRFCNPTNVENKGIHIKELDENKNAVYRTVLPPLGRGEDSKYEYPHGLAKYVVVFCEETHYYSYPREDTPSDYYKKYIFELNEYTKEYNDFWLGGGEILTKEEFETQLYD